MRAINKSEDQVPPLYVTAYAVSVYLGAMKPPKDPNEEITTGGGFLDAFGPSGEMRG